jgi:twitching motility protein PilT
VVTLEKENKFGIAGIFTNIQEKDKEAIKRLIDCSDVCKLLGLAIQKGASDLHLITNSPPILRIYGELQPLDMPKLDESDIPFMIYSLMSKPQIEKFEREKELTFGFQHDLINRFRINVHQQRGYPEATLRLINTKISSFEELKIPEAVKDLTKLNEGLIIVSGPTGSGKTTTLSAMVEFMNRERKLVIITLERPIEYVHVNNKSIIKQREVGIDTQSFSIALQNSLKQDPDVLVIGEMDDAETVRTAMIAAESGHLVIASFHAPNTVQAIDRLVNMFTSENRKQILFQLSQCLKAVITQLLLPYKDQKERVLAAEVAIANDAVRRVIRNDELIQLPTIIQTGAVYKMQSMYDSIKKYADLNIIDEQTANSFSEEFARIR